MQFIYSEKSLEISKKEEELTKLEFYTRIVIHGYFRLTHVYGAM